MKNFLLRTGLSVAVFALSACGGYIIVSKNNSVSIDNGSSGETTPLTRQEKLINNIVSMDEFSVDADLTISYQGEKVVANVNADGSLADLSDIKLDGNACIKTPNLTISADLCYYDSTIYLDYLNNHFKLETSSLLSFIEMLPDLGINVALPEELTGIDFNEIASQLSDMEETETIGGYYYKLALSEDVIVFLKSDLDSNFTGVRINPFFYHDAYIRLDASIDEKESGTITIADPETVEGGPVYQNFSPAFDVFSSLYKTFTGDTFGLSYAVELSKNDEQYLHVEGLVDADKVNNKFKVGVQFFEGEKASVATLGLLNDKMYINYNDAVKISVENSTLYSIVTYLVNEFTDGKTLEDLLAQFSTILENPDISAIINSDISVSDVLNSISISEDCMSFSINPTKIGLGGEEIVININSSSKEVTSIVLENIAFNSYSLNATVSLKDYSVFEYNDDEFYQADYAATLVSTIKDMIKQEQFRIEFSGGVTNDEKAPITVNGGFQFDVKDGFGYGALDLVDRDAYNHNIKIDVVDKDNMYFAYNNDLKGYFNTQTLIDMADVVSTVVQEKDDHFMELFGDLLDSLGSSPIGAIMNGDYRPILGNDLIKDLQITDGNITLVVNCALFNVDSDITIHLNFSDTTINYLEIKDFTLNGSSYALKIELKDFDSSLASTRLDTFEYYIDFSDIKVLLNLGINTSKFNDYHFTGSLAVEILSFSKEIPVDLKIKNNHGAVSISADIGEIPVIPFVNNISGYVLDEARFAHIYYEDGYFYINRTETIKKTLGFLSSKKAFTYAVKADTDNFMENILDYLCYGVLGLNSTIMDSIQKSSSSSEDNQIQYEKILNDFNYDKNNNFFYFDINLAEIANNEDLSSFIVKVYTNSDKTMLSSLNIHLGVSVGITIKVDADLQFVDVGSEVDLSTMSSYLSAHSSDVINTPKETIV